MPFVDAQLKVGHSAGVGPRAQGVLVVVQHAYCRSQRRRSSRSRRPRWAQFPAPSICCVAPAICTCRRSRTTPPAAIAVLLHLRCGAVLARPYSSSNSCHRSCGRQLLTCVVHDDCTAWLNSICRRRGNLEAVFAFQQIRDAALARLAVDANHRLIAASQVFGVDWQIRHGPYGILLLNGESLLDGVLVGSLRTRYRPARRHRDGAGEPAIGCSAPPCARISSMWEKSRFGRHALGIEVERHVDEVEVAGALTVAKRAAFNPLGRRPSSANSPAAVPVPRSLCG